MTKKILCATLLAFAFCAVAAPVRAGAIKEGVETAAKETKEDLEPLGEDVDFLGRSLFYGLGAVLAAPFRLAQDVFNAISQGASGEKIADHTN